MKYSAGADISKVDLRTFSYKPTKANIKGGVSYKVKDIDNQHRVGICTAISMTMNASKALNKKFSADFQYLLQKKYVNGNWNEGSSIFSACKVAQKYGMILEKDFNKFVTIKDRKLTYRQYIKKLQAVSDEDIQKLLKKAVKVESYAKIPVARDFLANSIDNSKTGILARFVIDSRWWTRPIQPLRPPKDPISGHAINLSNYDGNMFMVANSWGTDWASDGSAESIFTDYKPTEAYIVFYKETPVEVNKKITLNQVIRLIKWLIANGNIK